MSRENATKGEIFLKKVKIFCKTSKKDEVREKSLRLLSVLRDGYLQNQKLLQGEKPVVKTG